ncbi:MAG: DUF362 domain-containing protein [Negativicutes bacterium]|nr:DUF362 domain-containing protein [Negativicutes bacterium]
MIKLEQSFPRPRLDDLAGQVKIELDKLALTEKDVRGKNIAITAGSRGINRIPEIHAAVVARLKEMGANPFLISAMGSHGGGTPEGQREVLDSLGITPDTVGCPVICSSAVVKIGVTPTHHVDVYCAKEAVEADGLIVMNRIKCHTAFRAPRESGLFKMMGIGLGRVPGAESIHSMGTEVTGQVILELGRIVLKEVNVLGGIAIVENGYEDTEGLYGLNPDEIEAQEALLLQKSNELLPKLPFDDIDLLIVDEMGKDFSGTCMDTNIIGRWRIAGVAEPLRPRIKRVAVLDLTEASHGNANGIGLADFTTRKLVDKINYKATYLNSITTGFLMRTMLPMILDSDQEVIDSAVQSLKAADVDSLRVVRVKNTLHLDEIWVSSNLQRELSGRSDIKVVGAAEPLRFDAAGNIVKRK